MSIYKALSMAFIITGAVALLIYAGAIVADVLRYKMQQRRIIKSYKAWNEVIKDAEFEK